MTAKITVHIGRYHNRKVVSSLCGNPGWRHVERQEGQATCKFCLKVFERMQASAARSNTESSAGRIPRTPGR